jgi:hypothetical protein
MLALSACGDDTTPAANNDTPMNNDDADAGTNNGDAGTNNADAPSAPVAVEVTNNLTMFDWLSGGTLAGVNVCTNDENLDCAVTDAEGRVSFTNMVTNGDLVEVRADKEGYFPFLVQWEVTDAVAGQVYDTNWVLAEVSALDLVSGALGGEFDDAKGHATVQVFGPAAIDGTRPFMVGATVTSAAASEFGPKYFNAVDQLANLGPFGDDGAGTTEEGMAAFFNVDPGTAEFTVTAEGHECVNGTAGLPSETATVASLIEAGHVTYIFVVCELAGD